MAKIIVENTNDTLELPDGERIQQVCEDAGVPFACTEGVCGTCVIEVKKGMENLSPYTQEEQDFLGEQQCERLACQCRINSGEVQLKF